MPEPRFPGVREYDPKSINPCEGCSHCCEYIALEIDKPTSVKDFDQIVWYLVHKDVWVYVDDENRWHLQFNTVCEKLEDKRCSFYPNRPQLCRDFHPKDCVRHNDALAEKFLFKNEKDLYSYLHNKRPAMYKKLDKKIGVPYKKKELKEALYKP